jgi:hypothetical protein
MLTVGVHDHDPGRRAGERALYHCACEATAPDPPQAADARVDPRQGLDRLGGAVGGVVVDEDDVPPPADVEDATVTPQSSALPLWKLRQPASRTSRLGPDTLTTV